MNPWPSTTKAQDIVCMIVDLGPGGFHNFHYHPGQEEVIYLLKGRVEQWLGEEQRVLRVGDSVFIPKDLVHATFNLGKTTAQLFVVVSPCKGKAGYRAVDVSKKTPWKTKRV